MMKHYYLTLALLLTIFVVSCKNDPPDMAGATISTDGYQPLSKGSSWTYHQTFSDAATFPARTEVMTMNGSRSVINGKTYYAVTDQVDSMSTTSYFYQGNGEYRIRSLVMGGGTLVEYLYLKDNVSAGQTWTAPITDDGKLNGYKAQIIGKMIKVDTTMTISSVSFKHVAHTQLQLQYDVANGAGFTTYELLDFYIAKGVGIVEIETDTEQPTTLKSNQPLASYKIEK